MSLTPRTALPRMAKGGPEQQAIEAGEIDAFIDYSSSNVILLPAARRALRERANEASAELRSLASEAPYANSLLAALPEAEYRRLLPGLEPLTLIFGDVLHEPGAPIGHVYFPVDCAITLLGTVDGGAVQVGLVGHEGMVGISPVLGVDISSVRSMVQLPGRALRMERTCFAKELPKCPQLQAALNRYAYTQLALARQTVACNCFHTIEARLARWLLMTSDRVRSRQFALTQAFLAEMLGVRRATVNEAAGPLQRRNLIRYVRGEITILDRKGLEAMSCRCYARLAPAQHSMAGSCRETTKHWALLHSGRPAK